MLFSIVPSSRTKTLARDPKLRGRNGSGGKDADQVLRKVTDAALTQHDAIANPPGTIRNPKLLDASLRGLLDLLPDAAFLADSAGRLALVNALTERLFGYETDELHGQQIDALIPARFRDVHSEHCSDYFARPRARSMGVGLTLSALHKNGTEFPVEISLGPIETSEGTFVLGTIRDISQSEERYRAIFEQVTIGVAHTTLDGRILDVNRTFCEMLGYTREAALALHIRDLTHPDDIGTTIDARARMLARQRPDHERDVRLIRKGGAEIWTHIGTSLIRSADGRPVHFISLLHDVSAQKQADDEHRETELRFRQVTENISEVFWLTDPSKNEMLYVSPAYERIWGRSVESLYSSPRDWLEAMHPEDRHRVREAAETAQTRGGYDEEYRIVRPDGSVRWIRDRGFPVHDDDRGIVRVAGIAEDITEYKRTESALLESEGRFRAMIEQSISGTCVIDAQYRLVYVNPRLVAILGYESPASLVGRPLLDSVAPEDHAMVAEELRRRIQGETDGAHYSFHAIRKDGSRAMLGAQGTPGSYAGKRVVIATIHDVTDLERAEDELQRTVAKLRRAVQSAVEVVSRIGEVRDPYTHGHEHRVGQFATAIAEEMGLPVDCIEGVRVAGYLHDVGKIGVPTQILSKPTRLSKTEFEIVKEHAQKSYEILKGMEFPWPIAEAAWQHHERLDGSGYPRGLKGDEIILEARILAVADTVEAMASHRPYRPGYGVDAALAEIARNRGTLFDSAVVDACLRLFRVNGYRLPE
ncbi:MAG: PAS domain S-box protein [Casimicrobiaceae bacterium]